VAVNTASFGAALTLAGVTAQAVVVVDALAPTGDGCDAPFANAASLVGKIAVIDRGVCTFVIKAKNAQNAGAIGCILVNNVAGALAPGGADPTITIPTVGITLADGNTLKTAIAGGPTTVTLHLNPTLLAGAHPSGHVRMFAPNPFQGGSSVSHYDVSLTPNALMEPAINADLSGSLDLTVDLFHDIGWFGRGGPVATQLALVAADLVNGHPHLEWFSSDGARESMRLYRAALPAGFERMGNLSASGTGMVTYDDMDVVPGRSYEYQLGLQTSAGERLLGFAHVDVPFRGQLAIKRLPGNATAGALAFSEVQSENVRDARLDGRRGPADRAPGPGRTRGRRAHREPGWDAALGRLLGARVAGRQDGFDALRARAVTDSRHRDRRTASFPTGSEAASFAVELRRLANQLPSSGSSRASCLRAGTPAAALRFVPAQSALQLERHVGGRLGASVSSRP
jgi:hypothetical protein